MKRFEKICVIGLKMKGFKRFSEEYEMQFGMLTYIMGGNGQGKTSIADALAFAFCGTPFWGEHSCDRLQNPESKEMRVDVRFVDENGELHTLSRARRGNDTAVVLDGNSIRQTDVATVFAEKSIMLSLLNPQYFIEKLADDGRELLQKLIPAISDDEVKAQLSETTRNLLLKEHLSDPDYYIKNRREERKALLEENTALTGQIDLLKQQSQEVAGKLDAVIAQGEQIVKRIKELEDKQFHGVDVEALKAQQESVRAKLSAGKREELLVKRTEVENRQYSSKFEGDIMTVKAELAALGNRYRKIAANAKEIQIGDVCPTCKTVVTEENYPSILDGFKKELAVIGAQGTTKKQALAELEEMEAKSRQKFEEFQADDLKKLDKMLEETDGGDVGELAVLEDRIRMGNLSGEEFAELAELSKKAEAYSVEVNMLCENDKASQQIAELEETLKKNQEQCKHLESLIRGAGEFAAKRAEMLLRNLSMNHAAFKLFDVAKTTGEVKNVFRFTYDGKDYRWLSTSEKIKAGLEVSKLLAKLTGLTYPTYIDNAECITTKLEPMPGQVILAFARNCALNVQLPKQKQEQEAA